MKFRKNSRKLETNQTNRTASGSLEDLKTKRDSSTRKKEDCRGGDDVRLRRFEEKLENVFKRQDPRQRRENIEAETEIRLSMEEGLNTLSRRIQNETQNREETEPRVVNFSWVNKVFCSFNLEDIPAVNKFARHCIKAVRRLSARR